MKKQTFLIVICEEKNLKIVAKTLAETGFGVWSGRQLGNIHILHLTGLKSEITRAGCALIGLEHSFPSMKIALIDKNGLL
jgi:hypothetical protein